MCREHCSTLLLLQGSSKVAVGFFTLCIFWVQNLSQLHMQAVMFLVPTVSLYFVDLGEVCPGASTEALQQKVPYSRPVSK